jgi:signal transduction histidine kinase
MIGIIPILFLIYFSILIYREKSQTVTFIHNYIEHVEQSEHIGGLISELSWERRYSYQNALKKENFDSVKAQRKQTDSIINILKNSPDPDLNKFTSYTFLDILSEVRADIDTVQDYPPEAILQYYTDAIIRLNTLTSTNPPPNSFLAPIYTDLIAQKTLLQMTTYLGILRTNIYNAISTNNRTNEVLLSNLGMYKIYKSYETEFLLKAAAPSIALYNHQKETTEFKYLVQYIDKVFTTLKLDDTYTADQWWNLSSAGMRVLRQQQKDLWKGVDVRMKAIYREEIASKNGTFIFMMVSILFVLIFVAYTINHITGLLRELKLAARKISRGGTGLELKDMPKGVISNLAKSIIQIDKNNILLSKAADQIGKGNFDVAINPRSDEDLLGLSIKKMKGNLRAFSAQKDKIQKETEELVRKRDDFFSVASHELKTPVTSLKAYTQLLLMDAAESGDVHTEQILEKMHAQINKLTALITGLLDSSKVQTGQMAYDKQIFPMETLITETIDELKLQHSEHQLILKSNSNAEIFADRERIKQVLKNLLSNAVKYASKSKEIIVELIQHQDKIICSVKDFGHGIVEDEIDKIFHRFYRITGNKLHTYPGLGLGLYISKEIIQNHSGKMWVESQKGEGSTFYFELPLNTVASAG